MRSLCGVNSEGMELEQARFGGTAGNRLGDAWRWARDCRPSRELEVAALERVELQRNILVGVVVVLLATLVMLLSREADMVGGTSVSAAELERILQTPAAIPAEPESELSYPPPPDNAQSYFAFEVDKHAVEGADNRKPSFPEVLRGKFEAGDVLFAFIVDSAGLADTASVKVLESTDPEFTKAARIALQSYRFIPAEIAGRKVRQHVRLPFRFSAVEREP